MKLTTIFSNMLVILLLSFSQLNGNEAFKIQKGYTHNRNFVFPFLHVETIRETSLPYELLVNKIENYFIKTKLPYKAHYFDKGISIDALTIDQFLLPYGMNTKDFKFNLKNCQKDNCSIKLHLLSEQNELLKTPPPKRIEVFKKLLFKRVERFLINKELKGYDSRIDNISVLKEALAFLTSIKEKFPLSFNFIIKDFWKSSINPPTTLKQSFLRESSFDIKLDNFQIPYLVNELLIFEEEKNKLFIEINIYSSFSISFYCSSIAILKNEKKITVLLNTISEFDELKKASYYLILNLPKYQEAVSLYHEALLSRLIGKD